MSLITCMFILFYPNARFVIETVHLKVNGSQSDKDEKFKAGQYVAKLKVSP